MRKIHSWLNIRSSLLVMFYWIMASSKTTAQIYVETVGGVFPFDICNCTLGPPAVTIGSSAIAVAPNLNIYLLSNAELLSFNPATGITTVIAQVPNGGNGMVTATNGTVYVIGTNPSGINASLTAINPATGVVTNLGDLPAGIFPSGDLFFYNGNLYGTVEFNGVNNIALIPIGNPAAATLLFGATNWSGIQAAASFFVNGVETVFVSTFDGNSNTEGLFQLNMVTGDLTLVCPGPSFFDLAALTGSSFAGCCNNFAGTFAQTGPVTACQNQPVNLTHNGNQVLNAGSALSFILVTNPTAVLPSGVLQVSSSPNFVFDPNTMTTLTTYYVAAVAAPLINGVPAWSSSCINISTYIPVQWGPSPIVSFSVANPLLCSGGCRTITANFTGSPPFNLTYNTPSGTFSQVFATNTGTFQVCAPVGAPTGPFSVQAVSLVDGFCTCN